MRGNLFARSYFRNIRRLDFDFRVGIRSTTTRLNGRGPSECRSVSLRARAKRSRSLKLIQVRVRRRWTASRAHGSPAPDRVSFEYDVPPRPQNHDRTPPFPRVSSYSDLLALDTGLLGLLRTHSAGQTISSIRLKANLSVLRSTRFLCSRRCIY